eukprot:393070_1
MQIQPTTLKSLPLLFILISILFLFHPSTNRKILENSEHNKSISTQKEQFNNTHNATINYITKPTKSRNTKTFLSSTTRTPEALVFHFYDFIISRYPNTIATFITISIFMISHYSFIKHQIIFCLRTTTSLNHMVVPLTFIVSINISSFILLYAYLTHVIKYDASSIYNNTYKNPEISETNNKNYYGYERIMAIKYQSTVFISLYLIYNYLFYIKLRALSNSVQNTLYIYSNIHMNTQTIYNTKIHLVSIDFTTKFEINRHQNFEIIDIKIDSTINCQHKHYQSNHNIHKQHQVIKLNKNKISNDKYINKIIRLQIIKQ